MPDPDVTLRRAGVRTVGVLKEFRHFVLRGNLVDLAVAVVIGTAFTAVVNSLVKGLITPLIAAIFGQPDFGSLDFKINGSTFAYGQVINALLTFVIVAAVVFFFVVKPVNALMDRYRTEPDVERPTRDCPECLSKIPVAARRCSFCTAQVGPGQGPTPAYGADVA
jgi:large conductance mechanosensitive channel